MPVQYKLVVRIPIAAGAWLKEQARRNRSSVNTEIIRAIHAEMERHGVPVGSAVGKRESAMLPKSYERKVRRLARRKGYRIEKSREREHTHNRGQFQLVDGSSTIVMGRYYDASLAEIETYLESKL